MAQYIEVQKAALAVPWWAQCICVVTGARDTQRLLSVRPP